MLTDLAGPADVAALVVVRHVGRGHELLDKTSDGIGIDAHAPLFHHHVALLVELAGDDVGQAARFHPRPQLQPVFRHRPEVLRIVERRLRIQIVRAIGFGNLSELVGDDVFLGLGLGVEESLVQRLQLGFVAADGLEILGFVGVVGRFHFFEREFFLGVVLGADLRGAFEGQVLEHVREAALAGGVVHVARVDECGVTEDRRLVALADDQREPVGKHFDGGCLLEALQIRA